MLPEAYLFGLAYLDRSARQRDGYFCGRYSKTGWRAYFPLVFAIKTPIPIMLLAAAGTVAILRRKTNGGRKDLFLIGLTSFAALYAVVSIFSRLNIGQRHLLPIYPVVFVLAAASACWWKGKAGRAFITLCGLWLLAGDLWIHPHYLCYFNEFAGGPGRGHLFVADSNIDWGQDLIRLHAYTSAHPNEDIKLAYFGSADPASYGVEAEDLLSSFSTARPATLTAGTYILSVTQSLGVYDEPARPIFWANGGNRAEYRRLYNLAQQARIEPPRSMSEKERAELIAAAERWARLRLVSRLADRDPDVRIGYSLFVYHLAQADVDDLVAP